MFPVSLGKEPLEGVTGSGGKGEGLSCNALEKISIEIKGDGEEAHLLVGVLHMPVLPAYDYHLSLMQHHIGAVDQVMQ